MPESKRIEVFEAMTGVEVGLLALFAALLAVALLCAFWVVRDTWRNR